jgi:hypothetical protein
MSMPGSPDVANRRAEVYVRGASGFPTRLEKLRNHETLNEGPVTLTFALLPLPNIEKPASVAR